MLPSETFRCPSDILITSWLFTARWSTWPGNHLVPCVAERHSTATDQIDKRGTLDQKTPMCMNRDAGSYQLSHTWDQVISRSRAPSSCKQSRRDQDVRRTSKRCHWVTHFQLCKVRSFYVINLTKLTLVQVIFYAMWSGNASALFYSFLHGAQSWRSIIEYHTWQHAIYILQVVY